MRKDVRSGRVKQLRGRLRSWWGRLTGNDETRLDGEAEVLVGTLQQRYGEVKERAVKVLADGVDDLAKRAKRVELP
jgi:uncharacterized protein YjbJ (UPF0337 family)